LTGGNNEKAIVTFNHDNHSVFNIVTLKAQPLDINAQAYILIDSKTGQVLAEHNPDLRTYPASTTKIMTAILALELGDLNQ